MAGNKVVKISAAFIAIGIVFLVIGYCFGGFKAIYGNINGFHIAEKKDMVSETKDVDNFENINIDVGSADIEIEKGEKYKIDMEYDKSVEDIAYNVSENCLYVSEKHKSNSILNFDLFSINDTKNNGKIKIYIPDKAVLSAIKLQLECGDITYRNISFVNTDVVSNVGNVLMENMNCNNINVHSKCGDMIFNNINGDKLIMDSEYGAIKAKNIKIGDLISTLKCGDMTIDNVTYENGKINNDYGDVKCTNIKSNGLDITDKCGEIDIDGELRGINEINSQYGDVNINTSLVEKDYSYDFHGELGDFSIDGKKYGEGVKKSNSSSNNSLTADCKCGDLNVSFKN